jgi:putative ABC transport system permease protein
MTSPRLLCWGASREKSGRSRIASMRALSVIMSELTFAARRLAADRWAAGAAILAIAIGAGLNTAVFAAAYGILLRPLPYKEPSRLAVMDVVKRSDEFQIGVRLHEFEEWRRTLRGFDDMAAYVANDLVVRGAGDPRLVQAAIVSESFFDVIGTPPLRGRLFTARTARHDRFAATSPASTSTAATSSAPTSAASTSAGGNVDQALVVVSDRLARAMFGDVDAAVGKRLLIGNAAVTISGVLSREVGFPADDTDLWVPTTAMPIVQFTDRGDARHYRGIGRVRAEITFEQARDELQRLRDARAAAAEAAEASRDRSGPPPRREDATIATVVPVDDALRKSVRPIVWTFAAGVALVLLIACANVATILVGRTMARQRQLAVQRALGAGAWRLVANLLAESLVIAIAGSVLGLFIAWISVRVLRTTGADLVPRVQNVAIDWRVFVFASLLALAVAIVAAIVPARRGLAASLTGLRAHSGSPGRSARRARAVLSVAQVALAVVILAGGALLVRTVIVLMSVDTGVNPRGAVSMRLLVTDTSGFAAADRAPLVRELLDRVRALPGVTAAGIGANLPPTRNQIQMAVRMIRGKRDETLMLSLAPLTDGYLDALGARVLRGRLFEARDAATPYAGVVISATAARHMFDSLDVIGRPLPLTLPRMPKGTRATVIGVVDDVRYSGLEGPPGAAVYVTWQALPFGQVFMAVRGTGDPMTLAHTVRRTLREIDATLPVVDGQPLVDVIEGTVADRRLRALLGGSIALLAFAVALVGLAGGLLHAVTERRRELAIRAALGATPHGTMRMVLGEGVILIASGLIAGLAASLAINRMLAGLLYGVTPTDPLSLAAVAALVATIAITVCYLPARRAAKADPVELLRAE